MIRGSDIFCVVEQTEPISPQNMSLSRTEIITILYLLFPHHSLTLLFFNIIYFWNCCLLPVASIVKMDDVINVSRISMHWKCEKNYFQNIHRKEKIYIGNERVRIDLMGLVIKLIQTPKVKIETFLTFVGIELCRLRKLFLSFFKVRRWKIWSLRKSSFKTFLPQAFSPFLPLPTTLKSGKKSLTTRLGDSIFLPRKVLCILRISNVTPECEIGHGLRCPLSYLWD